MLAVPALDVDRSPAAVRSDGCRTERRIDTGVELSKPSVGVMKRKGTYPLGFADFRPSPDQILELESRTEFLAVGRGFGLDGYTDTHRSGRHNCAVSCLPLVAAVGRNRVVATNRDVTLDIS